jgi:hypothetical protein
VPVVLLLHADTPSVASITGMTTLHFLVILMCSSPPISVRKL